MNPVMDLFQAKTAVGVSGKLREARGVGEDGVLESQESAWPLLVTCQESKTYKIALQVTRTEVCIGSVGVRSSKAAATSGSGGRWKSSKLALTSLVGVVKASERIVNAGSNSAIIRGHLNGELFGDGRRGNGGGSGPVPEGRAKVVGGINILGANGFRVLLGNLLGGSNQFLLKKKNIGAMPGKEKALAMRAVSQPPVSASSTSMIPFDKWQTVNASNLEK